MLRLPRLKKDEVLIIFCCFAIHYTFQAASVFVLYATSSANTAAQKSNRKTITGGDVISAMSDMEFEKVTINNSQYSHSYKKYSIEKYQGGQ